MAELDSKSTRPTNVRVEYTIGMTIPDGNFGNFKPEYKISADVPDDVNPNVIFDKLEALAERRLEAKVNEVQADLAGG